MSAQEVIPLGARTLDELAISANENHAKMQDAAHQMLDYAIRIGGDLNEARGHFTLGKEFEPWVREHVNLSMPYARSLMRLSHYKDHLPVSADGMSIDRALAYISGLPRITTWQKGPARRINWEEARLLRDKGLSYPEIAGLLGCAVSTAYSICLPESERKANERNNRRKRARKQKALREAKFTREGYGRRPLWVLFTCPSSPAEGTGRDKPGQ